MRLSLSKQILSIRKVKEIALSKTTKYYLVIVRVLLFLDKMSQERSIQNKVYKCFYHLIKLKVMNKRSFLVN